MLELIISLLLPILAQVESSNRNHIPGDNGKSLGCLQICKAVVTDLNIHYGTTFTFEDRKDRGKSFRMARLHLRWKAKKYKNVTAETLCRIWQGGPDGPLKTCGDDHWKRVQQEIVRRRK